MLNNKSVLITGGTGSFGKKFVETILRDAHQSQIATRMTTEQMLPIVDKLDKVGYHAVECWGVRNWLFRP